MTKLTVNKKWNNQEYFVTIEKNTFIQVDCLYKNAVNPQPTSVKFMLGDQAEYDSYNLSYLGTIIGITEKTVTFQTGSVNQPEVRRLKLEEFCWRNYNFNLEKVTASNIEESYCI